MHQLRGILTVDDLYEALLEAEVISKGARCKHPLPLVESEPA